MRWQRQRFEQWKAKRVVEDVDILGGEPAFPRDATLRPEDWPDDRHWARGGGA